MRSFIPETVIGYLIHKPGKVLNQTLSQIGMLKPDKKLLVSPKMLADIETGDERFQNAAWIFNTKESAILYQLHANKNAALECEEAGVVLLEVKTVTSWPDRDFSTERIKMVEPNYFKNILQKSRNEFNQKLATLIKPEGIQIACKPELHLDAIYPTRQLFNWTVEQGLKEVLVPQMPDSSDHSPPRYNSFRQ